MTLRERVRRYWDAFPCGMKEVPGILEGTKDFFNRLERNRYAGDDFMHRIVRFSQWKDKAVLEVGCGIGADMVQFARAGARVCGVDVSLRSASLASRWIGLEKLSGRPLQADAESLPFREDAFDLVYSWGVIHHVPQHRQVIEEMERVCKKGGKVLVALYHRHSLVALQVWLRYGLFSGRPWRGIRDLMAEHMESPGTQVFSRKEALELFSGFREVHVQTVVTRYDFRIGRRCFLPAFLRRRIPSCLGWFLIVRAKK